jgi:quercetin dioxygenase-like cupin family protein
MKALHPRNALVTMFLLCGVIVPAILNAQTQPTVETDNSEAGFDRIRTVNILQEPRHRTVHTDGDLRLLDVQINPGDTTLPHTHDSAILYTFISNGEGPLNGRVSSVITYVDEQFTHRVTNEGPGLFRIIAMASYAAPYEKTATPVTGLALEPQLENAWFRSFRLEIAAGESSADITHGYPVAIVQVSEGLLHVSRADGITSELKAAGDWAWRTAGQAYQIHNKADSPVVVVINEALR